MGEKFKFRLENVLDYKKDEEENLRQVYLNKNKEKSDIENNISNLKESYNRYKKSSEDVDVITQKLTINYLSLLDKSISDNEVLLSNKKIEIEDAKLSFIEKQIEKKSIEKLKSKKEKEFLYNKALKEQSLIDEMSINSFLRKTINKEY